MQHEGKSHVVQWGQHNMTKRPRIPCFALSTVLPHSLPKSKSKLRSRSASEAAWLVSWFARQIVWTGRESKLKLKRNSPPTPTMPKSTPPSKKRERAMPSTWLVTWLSPLDLRVWNPKRAQREREIESFVASSPLFQPPQTIRKKCPRVRQESDRVLEKPLQS